MATPSLRGALRSQYVGRAPYAATCPSYLTASPTCSNTSAALGPTPTATAWDVSCNSAGYCMAIALVRQSEAQVSDFVFLGPVHPSS